MLDAVGLARRERLLDVACGPGFIAAAAPPRCGARKPPAALEAIRAAVRCGAESCATGAELRLPTAKIA